MLYPGKEGGPRTIGLARLKPGGRYVVTGATQEAVTASAEGTASLVVDLRGRTPVGLTPAS